MPDQDNNDELLADLVKMGAAANAASSEDQDPDARASAEEELGRLADKYNR